MGQLADYYGDLLIKQYWEKPNALTEIKAMTSEADTFSEFVAAFQEAFDLDMAVGDRLDIIGRTVGASRIVQDVIEKVFFGFSDNPDSAGFASKFDSSRVGAPFASKFSPQYTPLQLNDDDYRFFIKVRIASNVASAYMVSDDRISIQDVVNTAFDGNAFVVDNQTMQLTLYVSPEFREDLIRLVINQNVLPKPQGVRYAVVYQVPAGEAFGFASNPNSVGFASKFDPLREGGKFARKVIF